MVYTVVYTEYTDSGYKSICSGQQFRWTIAGVDGCSFINIFWLLCLTAKAGI